MIIPLTWISGVCAFVHSEWGRVCFFGMIASLAGFGGVKAWEIIDAWTLPSHYKVVKKSSFQIKPLAYYSRDGLQLGLSLNYEF